MFYDLDNPNEGVKQLKRILGKDGVLCIQVSYLYDTIKDMNFYDICHEHLEYFSLKTLSYLMEKNGMEVFDASTNFVNGGSLRIMAAHKGSKKTEIGKFGVFASQRKRCSSLRARKHTTPFQN